MDLGEEIFLISKSFPKDERFNLVSQITRAMDSVALNLSEGSIGQSNPEQKRFVGYAARSLAEVVTCLHKAKRRSYIADDMFNEKYKKCYELMNMIIAFKRNIR